MTLKEKKQTMQKIVEALAKAYPDASCSLTYQTPFQLLVATRLSAQCTDARVNLVTPALFAALPTPQAFANATPEQVEALIKTCGLYRTKARDLVQLGQALCKEYHGEVPNSLEKLIALPGIGRKTANLILGDVFGRPAVVADTHFIRLSNRFGMVKTKDPKKVEEAMRRLLPPEESALFCHRTVRHGRAVCTARAPKCQGCCLQGLCARVGVEKKDG